LLLICHSQISIEAVQTAGDPLFKRYNSNVGSNPVTASEPTPVSTPLGGIEEALFRRSCDFANITTLTPPACALVCSSCSSSSSHGASSSSGHGRPLSLNAQQQQQSVALLRDFVQSTGGASSRPSSADYGKISGQFLAERAAHAAATSSAATTTAAAISATATATTVARATGKGSLGIEAIECLASFGRPPRHSRLMTT
jgi:hypothetical protein